MNINFEHSILNDHFQWDFDDVYVKPNIPTKKIIGALSYSNVKPDDVLILIDDTVFGGAKDGMIITIKGIFSHETFEERKFFGWDQIKEVTASGKQLKINGFNFYKPVTINSTIMGIIANQLNNIVNIKPINKLEKTTNINSQPIKKEIINKKNHHLQYISRDMMYEQMKKVQNIGTAFNVASVLLGGNSKDTPISTIAELVERSIRKSAIKFRENIVNKHGITEFANDFAIFEAASYVSAMILNKLQARGAPDIVLNTIILDSFQKAIFITNLNENTKENFTNAMLEYADDDSSMIFLIKLYLSNKNQRIIINYKDYAKDLYDHKTQNTLIEVKETIEHIESSVMSSKIQLDQQVEFCVRDVLDIIYA